MACSIFSGMPFQIPVSSHRVRSARPRRAQSTWMPALVLLIDDAELDVEAALQAGELGAADGRRGDLLGVGVAAALQVVDVEHIGAPRADAVLQQAHGQRLVLEAGHAVLVPAGVVVEDGRSDQGRHDRRERVDEDGLDVGAGHVGAQAVGDRFGGDVVRGLVAELVDAGGGQAGDFVGAVIGVDAEDRAAHLHRESALARAREANQAPQAARVGGGDEFLEWHLLALLFCESWRADSRGS